MYGEILTLAESIRLDKDLVAKGRRLENFIERLLHSIPGIEIVARDVKNDKDSQEIDLSIWNDKLPNGLHFLHYIIPVECKNWKGKAAASDISWFDRKLKDGRMPLGIFVAANGITGTPRGNTSAYDVVLSSYRDGRTIVVITLYEIKHLKNYQELINLIKRKMCEMSLGRIVISTTD